MVSEFNAIRVWPKGWQGKLKQVRNIFKRMVKSGPFDNLMTVAVTVNTVVLAMDSYGISTSTKNALTEMNDFFTFLFIAEMGCKLIGLGILSKTRKLINRILQ
jgi:hypothetical protein